jgi:hypothetical protein
VSLNPPQDEGVQRRGGDQPPGENQHDREIADTIEGLRIDYETERNKRDAQHCETVRWQKIGAAALGAYTLLTLGLVIIGKWSLDSNAEGNAAITRAWVQDQVPQPAMPPGPEGGIYRVGYSNVGREPAFGVVGKANIDAIPAPGGEVKDWTELPVWDEIPEIKQERICEGIISKLGREVLYPQTSDGIINVEPNPHIQLSAVKSKISILIVYGCLAYRSPVMSGDRHAGFCWFYKPDGSLPGEGAQMIRCPKGNYAD